MRTKNRNSILYNSLWSLVFVFCSMGCSDDNDTYQARTSVGKLAAEHSAIIDEMYSDSESQLRDGLSVTDLKFRTGENRQHVFVAMVDLNKLTFTSSTPDDKNLPVTDGREASMVQHAISAQNNGKQVWMAINGSFGATNPLRSMALFYKDGVALRSTWDDGHDVAIYMTKDGEAYVGDASNALLVASQLYHALGGYGSLVKDGEINQSINDLSSIASSDNPRTAVGLSQDRKTLYIFIVDGRRKDSTYAQGLSLFSLARLMKSVGCHNAINLDGGGSTTLVVRQTKSDGVLSFPIINTPSDGSPRNILNGLLVIEK